MSIQREFLSGDTDRFAFKIAFQRDPYEAQAATPEHALSWGSFQLWIDGQNICAHLEEGEVVSSVHWYIFPLLEWFVSHWDFLLHEERLPVQNARVDAWSSLVATSLPPPGIAEDEAEQWTTAWHAWWTRHCILACREGGLYPDVYIRRWRDLIEISWGQSQVAGQPGHYRFLVERGCARYSPNEVAQALYDVISQAVSYLLSQMPESVRLQQLKRNVQALQTLRISKTRRRLALLAGLGTNMAQMEGRWRFVWRKIHPGISLEMHPDVSQAISDTQGSRRARRYFLEMHPDVSQAISGIFDIKEQALVVSESCQATLMFGSVSPSIEVSDISVLFEKLVALYHREGDLQELRQLVRAEPLARYNEHAWEQGYRLAEDVLDDLALPDQASHWIDVEKLYQHLGIRIEEITLRDTDIRAVTIAGSHHLPAALINSTHDTTRWKSSRRFTLAHELCHILFDRGCGAKLALASGPWAPRDLEQRANAFAAMLLMPPDLLERAVQSLDSPLASLKGVSTVARQLRTSFTATLEHLYNLNFIDESVRDRVRAEADHRMMEEQLEA